MACVCVACSVVACGNMLEDSSTESSAAPVVPVTPQTDYLAVYSEILDNAHSILTDSGRYTLLELEHRGIFLDILHFHMYHSGVFGSQHDLRQHQKAV